MFHKLDNECHRNTEKENSPGKLFTTEDIVWWSKLLVTININKYAVKM